LIEKRREIKTMTATELNAKCNSLFSLSMAKNSSVREWLDEHKKECVIKTGIEYVPLKKGKGGKKKKSVDNEESVTGAKSVGSEPEINTIAEWLEKNGQPSKDNKFKAVIDVRHPPKNRGCVQPTFVSLVKRQFN
jgi:hypothetical protein